MTHALDSTGPATTGGSLFLLNSLTLGGSEKKIVRIANALSALGEQVHIAHLNGPDHLYRFIDRRVQVLALRRSGRLSLRALIGLTRYIRAQDIQRIIAVNLHPLIYAYAASRLQIPTRELVALVNTSSHRSDRERLFMAVYAPLLRRAQRVVFGSRGQRSAWVRDYTLDPARSVCIHNGTDTDHYVPAGAHRAVGQRWRERLQIRPGEFVMGTVGVMRSEKAQQDLLTAAGTLQRDGMPVAVILAGDGPCRGELVRGAERQGVAARTRFTGPVDDVRPLLYAMDVFVLTSRCVETFSNAALEAMACGCCVVLSDTGGAREMVVHGESGFIYPAGDVPALVRILGMLRANPALRQRVAAAARRRVVRLFSFQRMLGAYRRQVIAGTEARAEI